MNVRAKRMLRETVRERRASMTQQDRDAANRALTMRLISLVQDHGARSISCFLSTPSEPDTTGLIDWAADEGVEVLLPVSAGRPGEPRLAWVRSTGEGAEAGAHGIREPRGERLPETAVAGVDLMLIPACAVDLRGMRLGWGLGYYDRCLAALDPAPPVYAVVFDEDVLSAVPAEAHDAPVTGWITPSGAVCPL